MRVSVCCTLFVLSALGIAFGQDTNFAAGPQYLLNNNSPLLARSISTPSMSLAGPLLEVGASNATGVLIPGAEAQTVIPPLAVALPRTDLASIYYGRPPVSVVEISFPEASGGSLSSNPLPASILDTGVWQITTAQALRERGYGVTLPEAAAHGKARTRHATHIYTNADIDRLHQRS
jgi:hypothetical protein